MLTYNCNIMQLDHHSCLIGNHHFWRSEVQPSRLCMSHSMHPQCCNEVFHLLGTFSGNPSLAVFSNSMGSKRLFHWRKLRLFLASFSPQKCNETSNLQIRSSHCFHAPRSGISHRSWDFPCRMHLGRTRTSHDFDVKNASLPSLKLTVCP